MALDIESLYRRHGPMVLRRCRSLLRDEEEAVEAMHDVFVQVHKRRELLHDRAASSLLYTVATNTCLNRIRARRSRGDHEPEMLEKIASLPDRSEERALAARLLDRLFSRQPPSSRVIAALHLVDGMTLEETAEEVGMSVSGVRKRLRALSSELSELGLLEEGR